MRHQLSSTHRPGPSKSTCQRSFEKGVTDRLQHPLHKGRYKLEELAHWIGRDRATLDAIAADRHRSARDRRDHPRLLGGCTSDDSSGWLKRLPGHIAYNMGYYALPAIAQLGADGATPRDVKNAVIKAQAAAAALVRDCEEVHLLLKAGIVPEYEALRDGYSDLPVLLDRATSIVQSALGIVP